MKESMDNLVCPNVVSPKRVKVVVMNIFFIVLDLVPAVPEKLPPTFCSYKKLAISEH